MPQVQSLFSIGNKPSDTKIQLYRAGKQFQLVLPENKNNWRYFLLPLGGLIGLGLALLEDRANMGATNILFLGLVGLVMFVFWVLAAFTQVGISANGETISLVEKSFGKIKKQDNYAIAAFRDIELARPDTNRRNELMEIILSFQDGSSFKFGGHLSDEEQNWIMREMIEYFDSLKASHATPKIVT